MADPFSVTGSAVGVVSLAIQVCKGLVWYINTARGADDRLSQIAAQTEYLATLLEWLESVSSKLNPGGLQAVTQEGVIACADALEKIREKLASSPGGKNGSNPGQQLRSLKRRLSYPFKQGDIEFYKSALDSVQQNLSFALQILEIDQRRLDIQNIKLQLENQSQFIHQGQQRITDRQLRFQQDTNIQFANHAELIRTGLGSSGEQLTLVQNDLENVQATLGPVAANISSLSSSVDKLATKLDSLTPHTISLKAIESGAADLHSLTTRLRQLKSRPRNRSHVAVTCRCHGQSNTIVYLRWPVFLSRTQTRVHSSHCPYSAIEEVLTEINLKFSLCSVALKRKAQLAFALARGAGSTSLNPALTSYRIVDKRSPAFKLVASFERIIGPCPSLDAWEKPAQDLYRLFATRDASPHDRLPNGQTLLHFFCSRIRRIHEGDGQKSIANFRSMARRMFDYMPREALERDDYGRTCLDLFFWGCNGDLIKDFLTYGIPVSIWRHVDAISWDVEWAGTKIYNYEESLLDCSDRMKAVLLRSESLLEDVISDNEYALNSALDGFSLYEMATLSGWKRGCELLLERGIKIEVTESGIPLLEASIQSNNLDVLDFWLDKWPQLDATSLEYVGNLEDAFHLAAKKRAASQPEWMERILSTLVKQRRELESIAVTNLSECDYFSSTEKVIDAQASKVLRALEVQGISVKPSLRPSRTCIYYQARPQIEGLDALYRAGFHDVSAIISESMGSPAISPLMFLATMDTWEYRGSEAVQWFLTKGANLDEVWPNTDITSLHCLGWTVGNRCRQYWVYDEALSMFFSEKRSDSCQCACSTSGCLFVTMMCKGLTSPYRSEVEPQEASHRTRKLSPGWSTSFERMAHWISILTENPENRWLVTEYIRLAAFSKLRIRHTCCELGRIQHNGTPQFHSPPTPRYPPDQLERIIEEDEFLVKLLDEVVEELDQKYERFNWGLEAFLDYHIIPKLDGVLERLKEEDTRIFAGGRRDMGVFMEVESREYEEIEDGESVSDSEDEHDSDEESEEDSDDNLIYVR